MLDLLSDFLDTQTTREEKGYITLADNILTKAEIDYEQVIEEILLTRDNMDSGNAMAEIRQLYIANLHHLLNLHSIHIKPGLSLKLLADIVNGLLEIDNHESQDQFFKIANQEGRPIEKLCEMLSMVTTHNADELMQVIEEVSDGFFLRLKDAGHADTLEDDNELHERRERIHAYRKFDIYLSSIGGSIVQVPNLLARGINPAMPFSLYTGLIDGLQPIQSMHPLLIARELFAAALISSDGYSNPGETVKNCLEEYIPELNAISAVMIEVRQLMMGYSK